ncbi:SGNH/GDSL hydrolase family protein [Poritiphilus flavus]|uniref:Acylhydrolase n=1 Tax=Poritiphilus flavus TaxID=2697053 RepID=A0A6L9EGX1_9FLAO|nr:SGNH/GDSL hydrolase family protein [Poritiphilus flavus]NAS13509.1 acylhydrolase [Poritiphilus flavus]
MRSKIYFYVLVISLIGMTEIVNAQDWPDLKHFKAANEKLQPSTQDESRVVFLGNSITIGWLNSVPEFFEGKPYVNRGISGQTTPQMLLRFRQDVIDLTPKVVVILAGTNDIAGNTGPMTLQQIVDNLRSMTELAKANGIKVVLSSVLPAYDYPWRPGLNPNEKIPKLNAMIKDYADEAKVVYLDYFSVMTNDKNGLDEDLAGDGVHPTKKGYEIMAPLAEAAIKKALNTH